MEDYEIAIASDSNSSEAEEDPCQKHPKIDFGDSLQSISISPKTINLAADFSEFLST